MDEVERRAMSESMDVGREGTDRLWMHSPVLSPFTHFFPVFKSVTFGEVWIDNAPETGDRLLKYRLDYGRFLALCAPFFVLFASVVALNWTTAYSAAAVWTVLLFTGIILLNRLLTVARLQVYFHRISGFDGMGADG
jgi:hypothetical protein